MSELFANYAHMIVFLHVFSAFVWVGGMIAIRLAVTPVINAGGVTSEQKLQSDVMSMMLQPKQRLGMSLQITGRLLKLVFVFIAILFVTGLIMAVATDGHHGALKSLYLTKEILWTVMALIYAFIYIKRAKAWKLFNQGEMALAKAQMKLVPNLLLPLNIILGLVALWMGVSLRGL